MSDLQVVRFAADIEIQRGGDGRTVHGILVPWNTPTTVRDQFGPTGRVAVYQEAVARGAFPDAISDPKRVKFLSHHNRTSNPLGRGALLRDDAAGLYGEFYVSKTQAGDEALELVRDGALDAFSVGFSPIESVDREGVYVRTRGLLNETSLVTFAAYPDALVGGVRGQELPPEELEPGVGESSADDGSGDLPATRMSEHEYARALALASIKIPGARS